MNKEFFPILFLILFGTIFADGNFVGNKYLQRTQNGFFLIYDGKGSRVYNENITSIDDLLASIEPEKYQQILSLEIIKPPFRMNLSGIEKLSKLESFKYIGNVPLNANLLVSCNNIEVVEMEVNESEKINFKKLGNLRVLILGHVSNLDLLIDLPESLEVLRIRLKDGMKYSNNMTLLREKLSKKGINVMIVTSDFLGDD